MFAVELNAHWWMLEWPVLRREVIAMKNCSYIPGTAIVKFDPDRHEIFKCCIDILRGYFCSDSITVCSRANVILIAVGWNYLPEQPLIKKPVHVFTCVRAHHFDEIDGCGIPTGKGRSIIPQKLPKFFVTASLVIAQIIAQGVQQVGAFFINKQIILGAFSLPQPDAQINRAGLLGMAVSQGIF